MPKVGANGNKDFLWRYDLLYIGGVPIPSKLGTVGRRVCFASDLRVPMFDVDCDEETTNIYKVVVYPWSWLFRSWA